ncbi:hypothetical protein FQR65_LT00088 [Abscondita terminalis]|nr:hypothetical protein FQR65_LT00088 [Abscondita terminalis]
MFLIFLMCCVITTSCKLNPLPDEFTSRLSMAQCVANASKIFFGKGESLLVSLPVYEVSSKQSSGTVLDRLLFKELFEAGHLSVIIKKTKNSKKDEKYQKTVDNYVIQVRNVSELPENLKMLQGYPSWNPHAKFLIISVTLYEDNTSSAAFIVEQLWLQKIANGVILLTNQKDSTIFDAYSWFPFKNGNCGNNFEKVNIIDQCRFGKIFKNVNWFQNKIPRNLNGCPIKVRTVVWPPFVLPPTKKIINGTNQYEFKDGVEIRILNTMAQTANFSIIYTVSDQIQDWGQIFSNGSASGTLLYIKEEKADIAVSSFSASENTHLHFDIITYPIPESLKWCVPRADFVPVWMYFITVLRPEICLCIFLMLLLVAFIVWKFSSFQVNEFKTYKIFSNVFQNIFGVLLNVSIKILPRSDVVRAVFLMWTFFSLLMSVYYQTFLINLFSKSQYKKQIETVEEMFQSNLHLWFLPVGKRFFLNNNDFISANVIKRWKDCRNVNLCLQKTAFEKNSAVAIPSLSLRYLTKRRNIVTYPLEMILKKGFPYKEHFTNLVGWISDAGLTTHWGKQIFEKTERLALDDINKRNEQHFTITISHLISMFFVLGVSYVLGFVALLFELWCYKKHIAAIRNKKKIRKHIKNFSEFKLQN